MPFVATPNIGDSLGSTRVQMRENTNLLRSTIATDHVDVNGGEPGKHKWTRYLQQPALNVPSTNANESLIFLRPFDTNICLRPPSTTAVSGKDLAIFPNSFGTPTDFDRLATNDAITNGIGGWTFLPGVLLFQYGSLTAAGSSGTITFPKAFTTEVYNIQITLVKSGSTTAAATVDSATPVSVTSFKYRTSAAGAVDIYWTAIGF